MTHCSPFVSKNLLINKCLTIVRVIRDQWKICQAFSSLQLMLFQCYWSETKNPYRLRSELILLLSAVEGCLFMANCRLRVKLMSRILTNPSWVSEPAKLIRDVKQGKRTHSLKVSQAWYFYQNWFYRNTKYRHLKLNKSKCFVGAFYLNYFLMI